jgi:hypothetical protein
MNTTIGGYELESELGRGSTGTVYRAVRAQEREYVALKVLSPALGNDAVFRDRLEREAAIMSRLTDPHCVGVVAYGVDGTPWIAMEYVHGATLRAVLNRAGVLTPAQACGVMLGALAGLGHAHELGLVHRDVKPENVLVDVQGESKLADFGLVADRTATNEWRSIEGSPAYMSPEQTRAEPFEPRSDLYACGAMLYELLTGRTPYSAESPLAMLHAQVDAPLPPTDGMPSRIAALVVSALAKEPADRPQTAAEFSAALVDAAGRDLGPLWLSAAGIAGFVAGVLGARVAGAQTLHNPHRRRPRPRVARAGVRIAAATVTATIVAGGVAIFATQSSGARHQGAPRARASLGVASNAPTPVTPVSRPLSGKWTSRRLTITPRSLGAVRVGMTLGQAQTAAGGLLFDGLGDGFAYPTKGLPADYPHDFVGLSGPHDSVGCVGAETVDASTRPTQTISTPEGFELGGTVQHLLAVYGTRARYVAAPVQGMTTNAGYVVAEPGGKLAFAVRGSLVFEIAAGGSSIGPNSCTG